MQTETSKLRCSKCLCLKPATDFSEDMAHGKWCRKCYLAYFRTYNQKRYASPEAREAELKRGRERYARLVKQQRLERKKTLLKMFGGACSRCGYNKSACALDFDHMDNGQTAVTARGKPNPGKARTISHLLAQNQPEAWSLAVEEAKKCRVLCSNCHRELTFPGHELN